MRAKDSQPSGHLAGLRAKSPNLKKAALPPATPDWEKRLRAGREAIEQQARLAFHQHKQLVAATVVPVPAHRGQVPPPSDTRRCQVMVSVRAALSHPHSGPQQAVVSSIVVRP